MNPDDVDASLASYGTGDDNMSIGSLSASSPLTMVTPTTQSPSMIDPTTLANYNANSPSTLADQYAQAAGLYTYQGANGQTIDPAVPTPTTTSGGWLSGLGSLLSGLNPFGGSSSSSPAPVSSGSTIAGVKTSYLLIGVAAIAILAVASRA